MPFVFRLFLIAGLIALLSLSSFASTDNSTPANSIIKAQQLGKMPLAFTENRGQWDEKVKFRANAGGATMWFASDGAYYQFTRSISRDESQSGPVDPIHLIDDRMNHEPVEYETMMIKASFVGANPNPQLVGVEMMEYKCNYFIGNDPNEWHTDVPNYSSVVYEQVYDGIDLKYYGNGRQMEYDFIVEPGADYSQIEIEYEGAEFIAVNSDGQLVVTTMWGEVVEQRPIVYQVENDTRIPVEGVYRLQSDNSFGFELSGYNPALPLVIDPVLDYNTYLGGESFEEGWDIAVDGSGQAHVVGVSLSLNFPVTDSFYHDTLHQLWDVFVTKFSSSGDNLIYSTYLGGLNIDKGRAIAMDSFGNAIIAGSTGSDDFPTTVGAYQPEKQSGADVFVAKLNSSGNSLIYSTFIGGAGLDAAFGVAVDDAGAAYVTGFTLAYNFPIVNEYQVYPGDLFSAFVSKLNSEGSALIYSTYLGGSEWDQGFDIVVDDFGNAFVTGMTWSFDFPTKGAYQATHKLGYRDAFVTKLNSAGNGLIYSTFLGGDGADHGYGIALDTSGNAYITGNTSSTNFPTEGAIQGALAGGSDVFVTKLNSVGNDLVYSTYLGGMGHDGGNSIAVDDGGNACVTGRTNSTDFPVENAFLSVFQGGQGDAFVTKLNAEGDAMVFSTYFGGSSHDSSSGIVLDDSGNIYLTGLTYSADLPTESAYQSTFQGGFDVFVTKIGEGSDLDGDWIADSDDNCPNYPNPNQEDINANNIGDACESCCGFWALGYAGNTNCDTEGKRNLADITRLIDRVYISKAELCCEQNGNVDGDLDGKKNLADITRLIDHVYISKTETAACQ